MTAQETIDKIKEDIKSSMKSGNKTRVNVLRMLIDDVNKETLIKNKPLTEDIINACVSKTIKRYNDAIEMYQKNGCPQNAEAEKLELDIIKDFQPKQMSEQELEEIVARTVGDVGATSKKDMGRVMGKLMPLVKGKADGKLVNQIVNKYLN